MSNQIKLHKQYAQYLPLMKELVSRDLKVKYRRSVLGYVWSLLNPLLMMTVMSIVFSYMFRFDIENFPLYLICGQTLWTFFNESTNMAMYSVLQNSALLKKVYIPKYIFPISRVFSSFVTLSFSLVAILLVMLFTGAKFSWWILLFPIPLFFLLIFSTGVSMVLSSLSVYFRDITHLYSVITLAWMYLTPIFYPIEAVPPEVQMFIRFNPMYGYVTFFRELVLYAKVPEAGIVSLCVCSSAIAIVVGAYIFSKMQNDFILYL